MTLMEEKINELLEESTAEWNETGVLGKCSFCHEECIVHLSDEFDWFFDTDLYPNLSEWTNDDIDEYCIDCWAEAYASENFD